MTTRGRPLWFELMTTDNDGAQAFYQRVVGWASAPGGIPDMTYDLWMVGNTPAGGLTGLPEPAAGAAPHWLAYLGSRDVPATVARCQRLGGSVVRDSFSVPKVGELAILRDPQGAVFAVFKPVGPVTDPAAGPGFFSWSELATTDWQAARVFYCALLGWVEDAAMDMGPMGTYWMFKTETPGESGHALGGIFNKSDDMPGPPAWLHYVQVDDADAAAARVTAAGGTVLSGPMDVPAGGRVARCRDPQGAFFALHSQAGKRD